MAELHSLLQEVFDAQEGKLNQSEQAALEAKLEGALMASAIGARQKVYERLGARDWDYMEGVLRRRIDDNDAIACGGVSVNAIAQATATAAVNLASTVEAIDRGGLTDGEKRLLKHDLVDAEGEAKDGNLVGFVKAIVPACEKAGKCATSLTAVLTFLAELAKGIPTDGDNAERPI